MKLHGNAALGPKGRLTMVRRVVEQDWSLAEAAEAAGVSERTCWKWVGRYRADGDAGLVDRSSVPRSVPRCTSDECVSVIVALRKLRLTGKDIALALDMPASTVSGILTRIGLGKLSRLEPPEPVSRYERERPGELIHIDVKKLGRINHVGHRVTGDRRKASRTRGAGWEFVHVCIDDATRLAYVEVLGDEKASTAVAFLPDRLHEMPKKAQPGSKPARRLRYGVGVVAQEIIETAGQTLAAVAADPVKIVLFGSRARGDAGPDSDFDFLVVERDPRDRHAEMVRLGRALRPLGMPFDVVVVSERYANDWGSVEGSMVNAALTEGRVLHAAA